MKYESRIERSSDLSPGVVFVIRRMSFGRRLKLIQQVRDLAQRAECLMAGTSPSEKLEAAMLIGEIERKYVLWGLDEIRGLEIDGAEANPQTLIESGPEELIREALEFVKAETNLTEEARKN